MLWLVSGAYGLPVRPADSGAVYGAPLYIVVHGTGTTTYCVIWAKGLAGSSRDCVSPLFRVRSAVCCGPQDSSYNP